ncbi:MAG: hypothetical protein WD830_03925 [Chloroflexota bacterium]
MPSFAPGLVIGNTLFVGAHFALGFIVGLPAIALIQAAGPALMVGVLIALAVLGAVALLVVRRRRAARPAPGNDPSGEAGYGAWADAACPACFGFALLAPGRRENPG